MRVTVLGMPCPAISSGCLDIMLPDVYTLLLLLGVMVALILPTHFGNWFSLLGRSTVQTAMK